MLDTWEGGWDSGNPTMENSPILVDWDTGSSCWTLKRPSVNGRPEKAIGGWWLWLCGACKCASLSTLSHTQLNTFFYPLCSCL